MMRMAFCPGPVWSIEEDLWGTHEKRVKRPRYAALFPTLSIKSASYAGQSVVRAISLFIFLS